VFNLLKLGHTPKKKKSASSCKQGISLNWPENGPLGVGLCLEGQYDDNNEYRGHGETHQVPDEGRQPVADSVHSAHELLVLRLTTQYNNLTRDSIIFEAPYLHNGER